VKSFAESSPLIEPSGFDTDVRDSAGEDEFEDYLEDKSWFYPLKENGKTYLVFRSDVRNRLQKTLSAG
jgi:hypothetical protein